VVVVITTHRRSDLEIRPGGALARRTPREMHRMDAFDVEGAVAVAMSGVSRERAEPGVVRRGVQPAVKRLTQ